MTASSAHAASVTAALEVGPSSRIVLAHALAAAVVRRATLWIFHAGPREDWRALPGVRALLEDWKLLPEGSPKEAVEGELGVRVEKVMSPSTAPGEALREFVSARHPDLLVMGSAGRTGARRWARPSVSARVARSAGTRTLFLPDGCAGLVDVATGRLCLERILVPVDVAPAPTGAVEAAVQAAEAFGDAPVAATLLHTGEVFPALDEAAFGDACTWNRMTAAGAPEDVITQTAGSQRADLIVMATAGRAGLVDALRGSVAERVVRRAPCPVLTVPALRA